MGYGYTRDAVGLKPALKKTQILSVEPAQVSTYDLDGVGSLFRGLGSAQSNEIVVRADQGDQVSGFGIQRGPQRSLRQN